MSPMDARVAVVTGGSAGLGLAIVRELARHGCDVAILARGQERLEATAAEIRALGRRALTVSVDVSDAGAVEAAAEKVEREWGPIDVWVNNTSVTVFSPVREMTAAEYERITRVTYLGQVHGTLAALRRMRPRDRGVIVHVGSALSYRAIPLQSAYCASKHAIRAFVDALRVELRQEGSSVRVTMVQLPSLNTPQFSWSRTRGRRQPQPVPPIYQPEVGARAVRFAIEHDRREVWLGGAAAAVIVLSRLFPGIVDHYLKVTGTDSQFVDVPLPPDHSDNLFHPAPQLYRARGIFSGRARHRSPQFLWERLPLLHGPADWIIAGLQTLVMTPAYLAKLIKRWTG